MVSLHPAGDSHPRSLLRQRLLQYLQLVPAALLLPPCCCLSRLDCFEEQARLDAVLSRNVASRHVLPARDVLLFMHDRMFVCERVCTFACAPCRSAARLHASRADRRTLGSDHASRTRPASSAIARARSLVIF